MNYTKLYEHLGYAFYAIAKADGEIRKSEEDRLTRDINRIWLPLENSTDSFRTDAAHYIFIAFDYLHEEQNTAEEAMELFAGFCHDNREEITAEIREKILNTANAIADAYEGKNRAELEYLEKLKHILQSNPQ